MVSSWDVIENAVQLVSGEVLVISTILTHLAARSETRLPHADVAFKVGLTDIPDCTLFYSSSTNLFYKKITFIL